MKKEFRHAFSLVEIVIAIGVISFGLLTIVFLFSASLQSSGDMISQVEAVGVTSAASSFLEGQGLSTVYSWMRDPSSMPQLYAYAIPVNNSASAYDGPLKIVIRMSGDVALTTEPPTREGRMFRIFPSVSPNVPIGSIQRPTSSDLPAFANFQYASLGIQLRVYEVRQIADSSDNLPPTGAFPALVYDITLAR